MYQVVFAKQFLFSFLLRGDFLSFLRSVCLGGLLQRVVLNVVFSHDPHICTRNLDLVASELLWNPSLCLSVPPTSHINHVQDGA